MRVRTGETGRKSRRHPRTEVEVEVEAVVQIAVDVDVDEASRGYMAGETTCAHLRT
jgi:hypothetical protein